MKQIKYNQLEDLDLKMFSYYKPQFSRQMFNELTDRFPNFMRLIFDLMDSLKSNA